MIRGVIVAAVVGSSIGLIGYDGEFIVRGEATVWSYLLATAGLVGLSGAWWYVRRLRKQARGDGGGGRQEGH